MFKVLKDWCEPTRATQFSACIDLYASENMRITSGDTRIVGLGIKIDQEYLRELFTTQMFDFNENAYNEFMGTHYLQLEPRSSMRARGLQFGTGIIDMDYPDELKLIITNPYRIGNTVFTGPMGTGPLHRGGNDLIIEEGERIAQLMLCEHKTYLLGVHTDSKRVGGIGSTGK